VNLDVDLGLTLTKVIKVASLIDLSHLINFPFGQDWCIPK
jgi:hypothetical protein